VKGTTLEGLAIAGVSFVDAERATAGAGPAREQERRVAGDDRAWDVVKRRVRGLPAEQEDDLQPNRSEEGQARSAQAGGQRGGRKGKETDARRAEARRSRRRASPGSTPRQLRGGRACERTTRGSRRDRKGSVEQGVRMSQAGPGESSRGHRRQLGDDRSRSRLGPTRTLHRHCL
jgi:hypothetical protein